MYLFLVQKYLCKNMYILNLLETNCGRSMMLIPFHAIWCLCWYNLSFLALKAGCALRRTRCQALNWKEVPSRTHPQAEHFLQVKFGKSTKAFIQAQRRAVVWLIVHDFGRFSTQKRNSKRQIRGSEVSTEQWACLKFEKWSAPSKYRSCS